MVPSATSTQQFSLRSYATNKCLGIVGGSGSSKALAEQQSCNNDPTQLWLGKDAGGGGLQLVNAKSGLCLAVLDSNTATASPVGQQSCDSTPGSVWYFKKKFVPLPTGGVTFLLDDPNNAILQVTANLVLPRNPSDQTRQDFSLPGLFPRAFSSTYEPIGPGSLGPELHWGPECKTVAQQPADYTAWWVAGMYWGNTHSTDPFYLDCQVGNAVTGQEGDVITVSMVLAGTVWKQSFLNQRTNQSATFEIDMKGQDQQLVAFDYSVVPAGATPPPAVSLSNITLTLRSPDSTACDPAGAGPGSKASAPTYSADKKSCKIDTITIAP